MNVPHQHISLSALNGKIKAAISNIFSGMNFWVVADVTNHHHKLSSNYHYFELVEKNPLSNDILAKISGSAFGSGSIRIAEFEYVTGQRFSENIHVLVNVSVDYHPIFGLRVSLNDIDPAFTLGALAMERAATLARLVRENPAFINQVGDKYVTRNGYMKLNPVIQKIALLSSRGSAGAEDLKHSLEHNPHGYVFYVEDYFTAVQGDANAEDFKDRMVDIFNAGIAYDVVVITRGGGAQTDFLLFDNYLVGKAIAKFPIPVITGIGHQKNETIADLMANTALKTPTKVAEFIIAHNKGFEDRLLSLQQQIVINAQQLFFNHSNLLVNLQSKMVYARACC